VRPDAFRGSLVKPFVAYSLPIMPNNIAWWLVSACNRVIINIGMGSFANGIYAISNRFPSVLNMVTTFFYQAWQEQAITEYTSEGRDVYYSRVFNAYVRIILGGVLVLLPASKLMVETIVSSEFAESSQYLGPLFLSSAFNAFAAFYGTGYLSTRRTGGAFETTFVGAVVNVACTWLFIGSLGLRAAALGSMFGNLAIWLARVIQTRHYFAISVEVAPLLAALCLCALMSVAVPRSIGAWLVFLELVSIGVFFVLNRELVGGMVTRLLRRTSR
jgi:O-antigen/teichoic acid export membrane protein